MLPSVDSLLACRLMAEPPRGYSTAMPVSTLLWMLLPAFPAFLHADASADTGELLSAEDLHSSTSQLRAARRRLMHTLGRRDTGTWDTDSHRSLMEKKWIFQAISCKSLFGDLSSVQKAPF